ncbi:UDP-4-amino-4,6-dideoxy-N-acetyl-beta-L-altrosamine transaminase [Oxalobacteraceae bacterium OM1]|nr:UDP-4-amino-4,6-dideoxy-N-acetyl-beta-L-altrosamine transaminase [Oxalobacteraceae bacterium OM1]
MIPYGRQDISEDDVRAVVDVLHSDWLTQGPAIERFEQAVARFCGSTYAVAVANATAGLHIACLAAGLGEGDAFWTSPNTFLASANCGVYCGATPGFVDVDAGTLNMDPAALEQRLVQARAARCVPKIVIPVHFGGQSCDMEPIARLAREYGFTVIEDASHAIGGQYRGRRVGSCEYSDMTVFSFHPVKIITSGEGGIVLTNRKDLYDKLVLLRSHGMTREAARMQGTSEGPWYYEQVALGFNYRLTDMQAALGLSQLQRTDHFVARRTELAQRYGELLRNVPVRTQACIAEAVSAWHLYVVQLAVGKSLRSRREVFEELRARDVGVNVHYIPVHLQPYYRRYGFAAGDFPVAEAYYAAALTLPLYPGLSDTQQESIVAHLRELLT